METWIWMHFVAEAKHSVPTELNFLCLFPGVDSLLKLTPLPSLLLPDSLMEWQIFREVKVRRGSIWCPIIVFALSVLGGYFRKLWFHFPQQYALDQNLMPCRMLQDAGQQTAFVYNCPLRFLLLLVITSCSFIQFTWDISWLGLQQIEIRMHYYINAVLHFLEKRIWVFGMLMLKEMEFKEKQQTR